MINYSGSKKSVLKGISKNIRTLVERIASDHHKTIFQLDYILLDDESVLEINRQALRHDYYTDIITFDYSESEAIEAEIYISVDRVKENAINFGEEFHVELIRVMSHGVLHIMGYKDKSKKEKLEMREMENQYLKLYKELFHVEQV